MLGRIFVLYKCLLYFMLRLCFYFYIKKKYRVFFFFNGCIFWRYNLICVILLWQGSWAGWRPEVPSSPNSSVILGCVWAQHSL